ncbi:MAG: hypothetical protein EXS13_01345 [Planctomycetes bacterium]|nr:hypothetical protein [Planctomycetota bacterium]
MRVVVLHNAEETLEQGDAKDALAVVAVRACADAVVSGLRRLGHDGLLLPAPEQPGVLLAAIERARPDVVFSLIESYRGDAALEPAVVALLELVGVPFTGNRSLACTLALRKSIAKALLVAAGVPVAAGVVVEREDALAAGSSAGDAGHALLAEFAARVPFPWIVKPAAEDASHGIDAGSVVFNLAAAGARATQIALRYHQAAIIERFIVGRELNVALLGPHAAPEVLPLRAIDFANFPAGRPALVTYDSKWVAGSPDWNGTNVVDADLPSATEARVRDVALRAWKALGLTGYGRVDLRLDVDGTPVVLEANPNPDLTPDAGFALAWGRTGATYDELLARILEQAHAGPAP